MTMAPFVAPGRDDGLAAGRAKDSGGTIYYCVPGVGIADLGGSTRAVSVDTDYYAPFFVSSPIVIDQLAIYVSAGESGKNCRFGFYRADRDWQPIGAPLADSGSVSVTTTGTKTYTPGTPVYVQRGRYVSVVQTDGTAVTLYYGKGAVPGAPVSPTWISGVIRQMTNSRAYAAFPTPGGTWESVVAGNSTPTEQYVFYRVSAP